VVSATEPEVSALNGNKWYVVVVETRFAKGYYIEPTIFDDVRDDMLIAQEEVFGPVVCVIPYDDEEDAVRLANASS
jgi:acyl-CoA reductase-like NAD-dependent aldehyde dehydrogenase